MDTDRVAVGLGVCAAGLATAWICLRGKATPPYQDLFNIPVARVSKLYVYPVKSCHRIEVEAIKCRKRGLKYDRTFVVMDKTGHFLSQRAYPTMALIQPRIDLTSEEDAASLFLTAPGMEELEVKIPTEESQPTATMKVWNITGEGYDLGEEAGAWFSRFLDNEGCRLGYMAPWNKPRLLVDDLRWQDITHVEDQTSFSDLAPLLVLSESAMEVLNSKLDKEMEIERFRPNIILKDCPPHAEDNWPELRIGDGLLLRYLKPCTRCKMITVDQEKGVMSSGEPMDTLFNYRFYSMVYGINDERFSVTPMFGINYCVLNEGRVRVNDLVQTKDKL